MMVRAKQLLKLFLPPALLELTRRIRTGGSPEWQYIPQGWDYARTHQQVKGWNVQEVLQVYRQKWPKYVALIQGTGPLGISHEADLHDNTDIYSHNAIMSFAYVLSLAAWGQETVSVLDWGGGIGHYCLLAQALLPGVQIQYSCKDVPLLADHGARLFPDQRFYSDESCFQQTYDLVMASTSIHYSEDWPGLLEKLARSSRRYLYITGLPMVFRVPSFVFVQRPYLYGYNTEYLAWCINREEFLIKAEANGLELVREFVVGYRPRIAQAPEQNEYRGFLFRPVS